MAKSKYEYVKQFEQADVLLPGCWIVVRIDGKGFTKFTAAHGFEKPCDARALNLMDHAAQEVMHAYGDIRIAYGESDEYSFVFRKDSTLYGSYVRAWPTFLPDTVLTETPHFDGRAVLYPTDTCLRDYLSWRQVDTHINNQYNTCFWALVHSGKTNAEAQSILKGTLSDFKNELLFKQFGINYSHLPPQFRKGSVVLRKRESKLTAIGDPEKVVRREVMTPTIVHEDIIRDAFWENHPEVLNVK